MRYRFPIDYHDNHPAAAMASLPETAVDMLNQFDSGLDFGEPIEDRIERVERMICLIILRGNGGE